MAQSMTRVRTIEEARRDLERRGKSIKQFAREIGVSERIVYGLLQGRFIGRRGQAHRAAVLLGIKDGVLE
ncbi:helix-turn-helix domain-containing protein [Ralstonia mannitolilytica]|uniref:DNA-binding protein n=2 Tax=Burkholderiales TaxID=80840 RepID=UPI00292E6A4A|nr:DNA-binding protein [Ralstonia mannitolilytica]